MNPVSAFPEEWGGSMISEFISPIPSVCVSYLRALIFNRYCPTSGWWRWVYSEFIASGLALLC